MFCQRDDVKIIKFEIFHNLTTHSNNNIKQTMFFWFIEISKNNKIFDNEKFDFWANISKTHAIHQTLNLTSFDFTNKFDIIFFRFFFSTHLKFLNSICNALLKKTIWNNFMMFAQIILLMSENRKKTSQIIIEQRQKILKKFKKSWKMIKMTKKLHYEKNNFFYQMNM